MMESGVRYLCMQQKYHRKSAQLSAMVTKRVPLMDMEMKYDWQRADYTHRGCPVEACLDVIGGKGKGSIVCLLLARETMRFNELLRTLEGISQRILTKQLRELEDAGLVHREVFPEVPPRVEYSLTEKGLSLRPLIIELHKWGHEYAQ